MSPLIADLLRSRNRRAGSDPLLTYYDLGSGERTELSGVTFANWVDKTSHLLVDECLVEAGDVVGLPLASTHPGHWVTLVWELACWQVGVEVVVPDGTAGSVTGPDVALVVTGPDWRGATRAGVDLVACSLHPLGLGLPEAPSAGVLDYGLEVRGQPDAYAAVPQSGLAAAWSGDGVRLTQAGLLADPQVTGPGPDARRLLVRPTSPWATVARALVQPLWSGGSAVVVTGSAGPGQLERIAEQERASTSPGSDTAV